LVLGRRLRPVEDKVRDPNRLAAVEIRVPPLPPGRTLSVSQWIVPPYWR
jgi:hypothetical protein